MLGLFAPAYARAAPTISEFAVPTKDTAPWAIAPGPDGNLWITEGNKKTVARVTPSGAMTEYTSGITLGNPRGIVSGPDGNVWFTESGGSGAIARITTTGSVTEFTNGLTSNGQPNGITLGPDGNLWFVESKATRIGRISPSGAITEYSTGLTANSSPTDIAAGPDGNLWFTEAGGKGAIGRITPAGGITEFTAGLTANRAPTDIAAGPDGNLWFTENAGTGAIGRITPAGTITEFSAGLTASNHPSGIAPGDDGNLWFTEAGSTAKLGSITPAGIITEYSTGLTANSGPWRIVSGPDGNMWFTEHANPGQVGQITIPPAATTLPPTATSATDATLAGSATPNSQATTYYFDWGPTTAYGTSTAPASAGGGASPQPASAAIAGLTSGATYHFRLVASNASGTTYGQDQLLTAQTLPITQTQPATSVGFTFATLNASVDPNSFATTYHFEWGPTAAYGSQIPLLDAAVGSDSSAHEPSQTLTGLTPGTTYHFRVVATSSAGTSTGADQTFTTPMPPPIVAPSSPAVVDQTTASLSAIVNPNGTATTYHFDFGPTSSYGSQGPDDEATVGTDSVDHPVSQSIAGLTPGETYHYRVVATSSAGVAYGPDQTFTTLAAVASTEQADNGDPTTPGDAGNRAPDGLPAVRRPVFGQSATVAATSGTVLVRLPRTTRFVGLGRASTVPLGTTIDATRGTITLTDARGPGGALEHGTFWGGAFRVQQSRGRHPTTDLTLTGSLDCGSLASMRALAVRKSRDLWGRDRHGHYRTRGRSAVATVRGTTWLTRDTCAGTLVKVAAGQVAVRDLARRLTVLVSAGRGYFARRR